MPRTYGRPYHASLFVKNLPDGAKSEELKSMFCKYGNVSDVYIPLDYYTRRPRGFCYVQYDDPRDAEDALDSMQGVRYGGCELIVEMARSDRKSPNSMRQRERLSSRRSRSRSPRRRSSRGRSPRRERSYSRDDDYYDYDRRRRNRSDSRTPPPRRRRSPSPYRRRSYSRSHSRSDGRGYNNSRRDRSYSRD